MPSMADCLQTALAAGEVDRSLAEAKLAELEELTARYAREMPQEAAEAAAAADLREATRRAARSRRRAVIAELQTRRRIDAALARAPHPDVAIRNMVEASEGSGYRGESLKSVSAAMQRRVNGNLAAFLKAAGLNVLGRTRSRALVTDVIRTLHGDDTGNPAAAAFADAVRREQERLRGLFNAHGGDIGHLENYGVRHTHDARRIREAGLEAWRDAIAPRLDWSRIEDHDSGKVVTKILGDTHQEAAKKRILRGIFEGIVTDGWNRREPSMTEAGRGLANRRAEARVLHFASGSDWLAYNRDFGRGDPFDSIVGGLHVMARDVAQLRVLGPNPRGALVYAEQVATKSAMTAGRLDLAERVARQGKRARTMLRHFTGAANATDHQFWADFFGAVRSWNVASKLGSAVLTALGDQVTMRDAARAAGLRPNALTLRTFKLILSSSDRTLLANGGYVMDTLASVGAASARLDGDLYGPELARRVSDVTMRSTGLSFWTDVNRLAFQAEMMGDLGSQAGRPWGQLKGETRDFLAARGFEIGDWDILRRPEHLWRPREGTAFINPHHLAEHSELPQAEAEGLATRLQAAIEEAMDRAVPVANLEVKATVLGDTDPGSFGGIALRSVLQFKSYPVTLTLNVIRSLMAVQGPTRADRNLRRLNRFARLAAGLTLVGALSMQLKELAKGRDPRPMFDENGLPDPKFWFAAAMQGGSFGIYGDFLFSETSRTQGGVIETAAGPTAGLVADVLRNTSGILATEAQGDDANIGRGVAQFVRQNTPIASSAWYARAAWDHAVADNLLRLLDPEADAYMRRQERRRERHFGTESYWGRGEVTPERAPDLSNAIGGLAQ